MVQFHIGAHGMPLPLLEYNLQIPVRFLIADFDRYLHRPVEGSVAKHHITAIPYNSCFDENTNWSVHNSVSTTNIYSNSEWVTEGFLTNNTKVTDLLFENGFVKIPVYVQYPLTLNMISSGETLNIRIVSTDHPFLLDLSSVYSQEAYGSFLKIIPNNIHRPIPIFYLHPESLQFYTSNRQNWLNWWMWTPYDSHRMLYTASASIDFGALNVETGESKCAWRYAINLAA